MFFTSKSYLIRLMANQQMGLKMSDPVARNPSGDLEEIPFSNTHLLQNFRQFLSGTL